MLSVGWTDWWLACRFLEGSATKAAMGLLSYLMWLIPSLFAAVAIGATAIVSRHTGAGSPRRAQLATGQAILLGSLFAALITTFVLGTASSVGGWMQLPDRAASYVGSYLHVIKYVIPLIMIEQVGAACLRASGDTLTGFLAKIVVVLVNIVVSATLIQGVGPFPELGWKALAIGTASGHFVGGTLILARLCLTRTPIRLNFRTLRPRKLFLRRLLRVGAPGGIDLLAVLICQFLFVGLVNRLGSDAAAAHGLAIQIEALAYLPGSAFQVAAATVAGQFLGARMPRRAIQGVLTCVMMGGAVMVSAGVLFFFAGGGIAAFFTGDSADPISQQAAKLIAIVAFSMPSLAIVMIITGAFRGAGDTRWPLLITLGGFLLIRIPIAYLLTAESLGGGSFGEFSNPFALGVRGAWLAMLIDLLLRSMFVIARFRQGSWTLVKV